jgi:prepilin-type N-terminal cleavage/methylation domain-containing protein
MYRRGFTIVELIIVITIMGILLVLGVVNLRGSQLSARDSERKGDIEAIALSLENFYTSGTTGSTTFGRYVSTSIIGQETAGFRDIDPKSLSAPGQTTSSLVAATCTGACPQTATTVTPAPTISTYVYQPLQADGTLCTNGTQECRKFNLYYRLEAATDDCPAPENICMVTSKNQ